MNRYRPGKTSLTIKTHRREARSHARQARWWELVGERELARLEWRRVTIKLRAAEIKRELAARTTSSSRHGISKRRREHGHG
jgi:hypothetical protein